jgi:pilus assembly protein CpaE
MAAKILVVDDDANVQRLLQYTLKQEGYDVIVAPDGAEGFRLWGAEAPDLILLDVMLPKLDGYQVATKIRSEEGNASHVPIIMLTAEREVEQKVRGLRAGADDYLIKPFHPAELLARIKSLLARFAPKEAAVRPPLGRVLAFYGAKGGVGTTTIAINAAIALHRELGRKVALVDGNLQFGDHRVFLDLGLDRKSIVDVVSAPTIDADLIRQVMVKHDSGVDLLLAPPSPETAELVRPEHLPFIAEQLAQLYDYTLIDIDKRLDDVNLGIFEAAETVYVVMTADLSCLKNVRLIIETPASPQSLERVHRHQRQERRERPQAHHRAPGRQRVPGCHQRAQLGRTVHVHQGRLGARGVAPAFRPRRGQAGRGGGAGSRQIAPACRR